MYIIGGENLEISPKVCVFRLLFYVVRHVLSILFGRFMGMSYLCGVNVNHHL